MVKVRDLARVLAEEFERDAWGDIDPYLFRYVAEGVDADGGPLDRDAAGLQDLLERVVARLREEFTRG